PAPRPSPPQDKSVLLARHQDVPANPPPAPVPAGPQPGQDRLRTPRLDLDPSPRADDDDRVAPLPLGVPPDERRAVQGATSGFAALLTPGAMDFDEAAAAG